MAASAPHEPVSQAAGGMPAYAAAPRRIGLLVAIACVAALAAAGYVAIVLFDPAVPMVPARKPPVDDEANPATLAAKAALDEASKSVLQPHGTPAGATDAPTARDPSAGDAPAPVVPQGAAVGPRASEAPKVAGASPAERAPPLPRVDVPRPSAVQKAPAPRSAPAQVEPAIVAAAPAPAPAAPAVSPERWVQMKAEISALCSSASINGLQCERRIRVRYCDGYWGTVPECAAGRGGSGN